LEGVAMEDVGIFYGHLVYFKFGLFYGHWKYFMYGHWVYFVVIWYIFSRFGTLYQEKSGNPETDGRF
jgi:hypothetical protein